MRKIVDVAPYNPNERTEMNTAQQRQPQALEVSKEMWDELSQQSRQFLAGRFELTVASRAYANDDHMTKEVA